MTQRRVHNWRHGALASLGSAAALSMLLTGCSSNGGDPGAADILTVDIAISVSSAMSAAPFAIANELGYFRDGGCEIGDQLEGQGGADPLRAVIDGGLDMGEVATNAVIDGYLSGAAIKVVGGSHQLPYDFTFAVRADSGIKSVDDMEGKRWGFTNPGSASEDLSYLIADAAGLPEDSVKRVPTSGMGGGIAMLEGGDVDAALMIPLVYERQAPGKFAIGFEALDVIKAYQKTVYIASEKFIKEHPEAIKCVLDGVNKAMEFMQEDPERAGEIYAAENEDYEAEELVADIKFANERDTLKGGVGFNAVGLENVALARQLRTGDDSQVPWNKMFDASFLPEGASKELPATK